MKLSIRDFLIGFVVAIIIISIPLMYFFGIYKPKEDFQKAARIEELVKEKDQVKKDLEGSKELIGAKDSILTDFADVGDRFSNLYQLCEDKYQLGISGDIGGALEIKGKMNQIETEIDSILEKYSNKSKTGETFL